MRPLVTIGVPVYNGERFLEATLTSLLAQDYEDFELIISDNASTDDTHAIASDFARRDERVVYRRNDVNRGAAWNYNHLVDLATTRYFKWSGCDDLYDPSYLRTCVDVLESSTPAVVLSYPQTVLIGEDGGTIRSYDDRVGAVEPDPARRLSHLLQNLGLANAVFGLSRTDALRRTRRIAPYNDSDLVLLIELALLGSLYEIEAPLFFRRIHAGQAYQENTTPQAIRAWFDPTQQHALLMPRGRRLVEAARSIARAPIPLGDRVRCEGVLLRDWGPRHLYHAGYELLDWVRSQVGTAR